MLELYKQAEEIGLSAAANQDEETLAAQKRLFDEFGGKKRASARRSRLLAQASTM